MAGLGGDLGSILNMSLAEIEQQLGTNVDQLASMDMVRGGGRGDEGQPSQRRVAATVSG